MREDEQSELEEHRDETCVLPVRGGVENSYGKVNILLQVYISREAVDSFSLTSDLAYVAKVYTYISVGGIFNVLFLCYWVSCKLEKEVERKRECIHFSTLFV